MFKGLTNTRVSGFTLVELLIVVVILSLLAATVGSGLSKLTSESKLGAVRTSAQRIQAALDRYAIEHGAYPDRSLWKAQCESIGAGYDKGTGYTFLVNRMKLYSNSEGEVCDSRHAGLYPLGPYLSEGIPVNPLIESGAVLVYPLKASDAARTPVYGWTYDFDTGVFAARIEPF